MNAMNNNGACESPFDLRYPNVLVCRQFVRASRLFSNNVLHLSARLHFGRCQLAPNLFVAIAFKCGFERMLREHGSPPLLEFFDRPLKCLILVKLGRLASSIRARFAETYWARDGVTVRTYALSGHCLRNIHLYQEHFKK